MMKKVLILAGSPRKNGNSDVLGQQFALGATAAGHQVETIYLGDMKLNFCIACDTCRKNGRCFQQDDAEGIIDKMIEADVIVLASPVYFYTLSAQMKTLIDRCVSRYLQITNKEFYFIATAAEQEKGVMEKTMDCFRGFTDCLPGAIEKGTVYGNGVWQKGEIQHHPAMKEAFDFGNNI